MMNLNESRIVILIAVCLLVIVPLLRLSIKRMRLQFVKMVLGGVWGTALATVAFELAKSILLDLYTANVTFASSHSALAFLLVTSWQTCLLFPIIYFSALTIPAFLISMGPGLGMLLFDRSDERLVSGGLFRFIAAIFGALCVYIFFVILNSLFNRPFELGSFISVESIFILIAAMILPSRIATGRPKLFFKSLLALCLFFWVIVFSLLYMLIRGSSIKGGVFRMAVETAVRILYGTWNWELFKDRLKRMANPSYQAERSSR
jgi:hypothetical protein